LRLKILVEKAVSGAEIEVSVLGNSERWRSSIPGEIVPHRGNFMIMRPSILEEGDELLIPAKPKSRHR